jgi:hypothetical protein
LPRIYVLAAFGKLFDIPNWILGAFLIGAVVLAALGALFRKLGWIGAPRADKSIALAEEARPSAPPPA